DLVHYLVEAELGLSYGVYGRAAAGGGAFQPPAGGDARRRAREQRRQKKREASLGRADPGEMATSARVAGLVGLAWRRRAGAATPEWAERTPIPDELQPVVARVLAHLDEIAPQWRALPEGGALCFTWPSTNPR